MVRLTTRQPGSRARPHDDSIRNSFSQVAEFRFQLDGQARYRCALDSDPMLIEPGTGAFMLHGSDATDLWDDLEDGARWVSLWFDPAILPFDLPAHARLEGGAGAPVVLSVPYDPHVRFVADHLLMYDRDGRSPDMLLHAKAIELLCAVATSLARSAECEQATTKSYSRQDIERLRAARHYIVSNIASAPTIGEIARNAGLNQQKLKVGFREMFGETIYGFTLARRMEMAWYLLSVEGQPIKAVAAQVGYRCANSFSRAFERHCNILPGAVRNRGRRGVAV